MIAGEPCNGMYIASHVAMAATLPGDFQVGTIDEMTVHARTHYQVLVLHLETTRQCALKRLL